MAAGFCVAGLGVTARGLRLGVPGRALAREALEVALADAGLRRRDVDGYIGTSGEVFDDVRHLGLAPGFAWTMQAGGATATWSVLNAMSAIRAGQAQVVACVYGAAPSSRTARLADGSTGGYGTHRYRDPMLYPTAGAPSA